MFQLNATDAWVVAGMLAHRHSLPSLPSVDDVATDRRFEDGHRDRDSQQVVLGRLEVPDPFGEPGEGPLHGGRRRRSPCAPGW